MAFVGIKWMDVNWWNKMPIKGTIYIAWSSFSSQTIVKFPRTREGSPTVILLLATVFHLKVFFAYHFHQLLDRHLLCWRRHIWARTDRFQMQNMQAIDFRHISIKHVSQTVQVFKVAHLGRRLSEMLPSCESQFMTTGFMSSGMKWSMMCLWCAVSCSFHCCPSCLVSSMWAFLSLQHDDWTLRQSVVAQFWQEKRLECAWAPWELMSPHFQVGTVFIWLWNGGRLNGFALGLVLFPINLWTRQFLHLWFYSGRILL